MTISEPTYEEKREKILQLCLTEATDIHLHNNIVAELLKYRSGDDPAFGNVVAVIYEAVTTHHISVEEATYQFGSDSVVVTDSPINGLDYEPWYNEIGDQ